MAKQRKTPAKDTATIARSARLKKVSDRLDESGGREDLVVAPGETRVISRAMDWCADRYEEFRTTDALEIKELIGVPDTMVTRTPFTFEASTLAEKARLRARSLIPGTLSGEDVPEKERVENLKETRLAAHDFVYGDSKAISHWKTTIDEYLKLKGAILFVPYFGDITVQDGGTLRIAADTQAVYANRVRLFGTGRIECDGPTTFDCESFEGNLKVLGTTVAAFPIES